MPRYLLARLEPENDETGIIVVVRQRYRRPAGCGGRRRCRELGGAVNIHAAPAVVDASWRRVGIEASVAGHGLGLPDPDHPNRAFACIGEGVVTKA